MIKTNLKTVVMEEHGEQDFAVYNEMEPFDFKGLIQNLSFLTTYGVASGLLHEYCIVMYLTFVI